MDRITTAIEHIKNNFKVNEIGLKYTDEYHKFNWSVTVDIAAYREGGLPFYQYNLFATLDEVVSFLERFIEDYQKEIINS